MHAVCNHSFSALVCQLFTVALLNSCIPIDCNKRLVLVSANMKTAHMQMPAHTFSIYSLTDRTKMLDYLSHYWAAFLKACNKIICQHEWTACVRHRKQRTQSDCNMCFGVHYLPRPLSIVIFWSH